MKRTIEGHPAVVEHLSTGSLDDMQEWLQMQAVAYGLRWLLAHADDGVVWGRRDNIQLLTSDSVAPHVSPRLRPETLQTARLFAEHAELLLWRDGERSWNARVIREPQPGETATFTDAIDELPMLWGTDPQRLENNFTLMSDGAQGLRHAVPLVIDGTFHERNRPLRLLVRHYLTENTQGFARIAASRLVNLLCQVEKNQ